MRRGVLLFVLVVAACEDASAREPPTWSYLHAAILQPSCATASCHSAISAVAGMDLSTPTSAYAALTGRTCGAPPQGAAEPGLDYIQGRFLASLYGVATRGSCTETCDFCCDDLLMPPDQALAAGEIALIERWFEAGAACD